MPEGDTVRRTAIGLHRALAGQRLTRTELRWPDLGAADLAGRRVSEVTAYGKHILLRLAAAEPGGPAPGWATVPDTPLTLHSHLRMDGTWRLHRSGRRPWPSPGWAAVRAVLASADWTAVGISLGMLDLVPTAAEHELLGHFGPDILADDFPTAGESEAIRRLQADPERPVGAALLDQAVVAGIGTFYMAETLFQQRISPWTPVARVDPAAVLGIARRLLQRGVTQPIPTTTGDPRRHEDSYVHARSGRPCRRCGTPVRVATIGVPPRDRPAFYCPACQPGPTPTDDGRPQGPLGSVPHRQGSTRNRGLTRRR